MSTIRSIKSGFTKFLLDNSLSTFDVSYTKVSNAIHPTKFTDANGKVLESINASDVGVHYSSEHTASNYLFKELFYDSDLEKENIKTGIAEVIVFTKIPKNSIRIPVAGGESYSPDFAYIVKQDNGMKNLHLVIETKDKEGNRSLFSDEIQKIKHAQKLFGDTVKVQFKTQFKDDEMREIIKTALKNTEI
jgi:type III restriction enzyme